MKKNIVVKSNRLVTAIQNLSLFEARVIQLAIVDARESGKGLTIDKPLRIDALRYAEVFGTTRQNAYMRLKEAEEALFNRRFTFIDIKDGNPVKSRWVQRVKYFDDAGAIEIIFTYDVVNEITRINGFEQFFTSYLLEQTAELNSVYSIRLYELLIQWRSIGKTPTFEINQFREQLGIGVNEYSQMNNFKARVLNLAVNEINKHTDILVGYEQHKAGRTVIGFTFTLMQKKQPKDVTPKPKKSDPKPNKIKQEEQLDWMTSDILDRFSSLSLSQQQAILDQVEPTLKGANQARFKVARAGSIKQLVTEFSMDINDALMRSASNNR
jgi:plasmid replication initiation protein